MPLSPGVRLGAYEVIGQIGAGGMGEVYRARDGRLRRDVALKILPADVSGDPERLARFEREARALAALNHPQIAAIYGIEEADGVRALVLELVEGRSLAERLIAGPLPVREALATARQIAEALDAAHEKGIVHRDLKPANVMVTPDGLVKVLDFGIAKMQATVEDDTAAAALTLTLQTRPLVVMGTAAYMSPEQARGQAVDKRTDIWAFGCVMYELLTGRRAFGGATVSDAIAAIIEREPDWTRLPAGLAPGARRLLRQCLAKDPKQRLRDIGDAWLQLDEAQSADPAPLPNPRRSLVSRLAWLVAGVVLASMALVVRGMVAPVSPTRVIQLQRMTDAIGNEESAALSPDGQKVAFVAPVKGRRQVFVRLLLARGNIVPLTDDDFDHQQPRWTQDSTAIVYYTPARTEGEPGTIWEIPALGGSPRRLMPAASGGDVSRDGRIAAFQVRESRMALIVAARDGSAPESVALLPDSLYGYPRWSPDDRWIAYQRSDPLEFDKRLYIVGSTGGEPREIEIAASPGMVGLAWLPDGSGLVYSSSQGSTVLYPPTFNLRAVNADGTGDRQLTFGDISYVEPDIRLSRVAATRITTRSDIWKIPVDGEPADNVRRAVRVTHQTGVAQVPSRSPDETEVVFLSDSGGHGNLWVAATDGSRPPRQITFERDPDVSIGVPTWSPTSNRVAYIVSRGRVASQWLVNSDGTEAPREFVGGVMAYWSPDGKWLYYALRRNGRFEIEKIAADGGPPVPVRADDAATPAVGTDGTLYWATPLKGVGAVGDWIIRKASPEGAEAVTLVQRLSGARVPWESRAIHAILSPDGKWLVQPLVDGATSNLWLINTQDGSLRRVTDYGDRPIMIARRVSWSRDSTKIYAAVAETDADIVLFQNLVPASR